LVSVLSYLKLRYEVFQNTNKLVYIENAMGEAPVELYFSYLYHLADTNRCIGYSFALPGLFDQYNHA